jgi:hypothetical protein
MRRSKKRRIELKLKPEFIKELLETQKENTIKVKDFNSYYKYNL